jgi:hypothetical protein
VRVHFEPMRTGDIEMRDGIFALLVILCMLVAPAAFAGSNLNYKAALHVVAHQPRNCDTSWPVIAGCDDIRTTYQGCGDFDVFPVFFNLAEVKRIEYAINWPADWGACVYTACAGDNVVGDITHPGDGIAHEWNDCHRAEVVIPGFARFEGTVSPGLIVLTPNPETGFLGATDCADGRDFAIGMAAAGVCGMPGEDPCDCGCSQEYQTWGAIKALFE